MKRFPQFDTKKANFTATINELGQVSIILGRINARPHPLLMNDEINPYLPPSVITALGPQIKELEMTPKTSTDLETFRPKKWGKLKTPQLAKNITNAIKIVEENFPNLNRSKIEEFIVNINEHGEITIKGIRTNAVPHTLFDEDGDMNESIPQKIKDILGNQISNKGLREQLMDEKDKKKQYKKKMKKMEELAKTKDDELKKKMMKLKKKKKIQ